MLLNADLSQRAVSFADEAEWFASPMAGVERRMLERDGDEIARATSVVRYRPGSRFPRHEHALGEEFLVLEGTFA
ncbi:cupin, partial [Citrobacter sp. AAK_AS5]